MTIRQQLDELQSKDIYSLMMFVLYKLSESDEYSSLSQLSYILDKDNLLKLCEYYGGTTIHIPTIKDLEVVLTALFIYQYVDLEHQDFNTCLSSLDVKLDTKTAVVKCYETVKSVLTQYDFNSGR